MEALTKLDFPGLNLGDIRRDNLFLYIINKIISNSSKSIPVLCKNWYKTKSVYNFFASKQVKLKMIETLVQSHGKQRLGSADKVLIAHDFAQISYNGLKATTGLGYLNPKESLGIISYNSLAISPYGEPLSLVHQETFVRRQEEHGKRGDRNNKRFEDKESYYWLKGISTVNGLLGGGIHKIHIADRESDIYEIFSAGREANSDLLIRAIHDRKIGLEDSLWQHLDKADMAAGAKIMVPEARTTEKVEVTVSVKYQKVAIQRPTRSKSPHASVELTAILLQQTSPRLDWQEEAVEWKLLTTLEVACLADALQCVRWYCCRWLVERFHYVLKSGTQVEKLQLEDAGRLQKAIHLYSIAAVQLMRLTYQSRSAPEESCELVLTKEQWAVLYMLVKRTDRAPDVPPTIGEAVKWIGSLGGHLGRKSDGPPGLKVIWRGYRKLINAVELYEIMQNRT